MAWRAARWSRCSRRRRRPQGARWWAKSSRHTWTCTSACSSWSPWPRARAPWRALPTQTLPQALPANPGPSHPQAGLSARRAPLRCCGGGADDAQDLGRSAGSGLFGAEAAAGGASTRGAGRAGAVREVGRSRRWGVRALARLQRPPARTHRNRCACDVLAWFDTTLMTLLAPSLLRSCHRPCSTECDESAECFELAEI